MVHGEKGEDSCLPWRVQPTLKAASPWKPSQIPFPIHTTLDLGSLQLSSLGLGYSAQPSPALITSRGCTFCGPEPKAGEVDGSYCPWGRSW